MRSPLKWVGGKQYLLRRLRHHLDGFTHLIEPFVGGGTVFLNLDYNRGLLADLNPDLIAFYCAVKDDVETVISEAGKLWAKRTKEDFEDVRASFNRERRPAQFLYCSHFGFNGLCRYNTAGELTTPYGKLVRGWPYFPAHEMRGMALKLANFEIRCCDFTETFRHVLEDSVVYCDPPFLPLSETSKFTDYSAGGFNLEQHRLLVKAAIDLRSQGRKIVVSNNDTPATRELYSDATFIESFEAHRSIAAGGRDRRAEPELLAIFDGSRRVAPTLDSFWR